jgi:hypothetical protein
LVHATHKETNDATSRGTVRQARLPWSGNDVSVGGTRSFDTESSEEGGWRSLCQPKLSLPCSLLTMTVERPQQRDVVAFHHEAIQLSALPKS